MKNRLAYECIENVLHQLAPKQRFSIATDFRLLFLQKRCLPLIANALNGISGDGRVDLLHWLGDQNAIYNFTANMTRAHHGYRRGPIVSAAWVWRPKYQCDCSRSDPHRMFYTYDAIHMASRNGHMHVLEWWWSSNLLLIYTHEAVDAASANGHVRILQWWKASGLDVKYSKQAMVSAIQNGHVHVVQVLQWWERSGYDGTSDWIWQPAKLVIKKIG